MPGGLFLRVRELSTGGLFAKLELQQRVESGGVPRSMIMYIKLTGNLATIKILLLCQKNRRQLVRFPLRSRLLAELKLPRPLFGHLAARRARLREFWSADIKRAGRCGAARQRARSGAVQHRSSVRHVASLNGNKPGPSSRSPNPNQLVGFNPVSPSSREDFSTTALF